MLAGRTEMLYNITDQEEKEKTPVVEKVVARQKRISGRAIEYMAKFDSKLPEQSPS